MRVVVYYVGYVVGMYCEGSSVLCWVCSWGCTVRV